MVVIIFTFNCILSGMLMIIFIARMNDYVVNTFIMISYFFNKLLKLVIMQLHFIVEQQFAILWCLCNILWR